MRGKDFSIYGVHIPRKSLNLCCFTHAPVPHSKLQVEVFVSPKTERVEEAMICSIKIQSENIKMTWNISLFLFGVIANFSKCDGFTILEIISVKLCGSMSAASSLQPW